MIGDAAKIFAYRSGLFPSPHQIASPLKRLELAEVVRVLDLKRGDVVLDLCCGSGLPGQIIARRAGRVIGVDLDPQQIVDAEWHRRHSRVGARVALMHANAEQLPLEDRTVDVCISLCSIEHIADARRACYEVHRVLRPGGLFVLTADSLGNVSPSFPRQRHATMYAVNTYYSTVSLSVLLEQSGFVVDCCRPILRSAGAVDELLASMTAERRTSVLASARIRRKLAAAEQAASGDTGLFVLAVARKVR
jgi:SAM-dependent methyltransferase